MSAVARPDASGPEDSTIFASTTLLGSFRRAPSETVLLTFTAEAEVVASRNPSDYQRMAIMLPVLEFFLGVLNNLGGTSWNEFQAKSDHPLSPEDKSLLGGVIESVPWNLKIFAALLSDMVPVCSRRRVPYLILGLLTMGSCWMLLGFFGDSMTFPYLCLLRFISTMGQMITGVMCDSMLVENIRHESGQSVGKLQANTYMMFAVGGLIGTLFSGWLPQYCNLSYTDMFVVVGVGRLSLLTIMPFLRDPTITPLEQGGLNTVQEAWAAIWNTVTLLRVLKPLLFIFVFTMMPNNGATFNTYLIINSPVCVWDAHEGSCLANLYDDDGDRQYEWFCAQFQIQNECNSRWGGLSFTPSMFAYIGLLGSVGGVLGNFLFKVWLIRTQWHCMFATTVVIASAFSALQLFLMIRDTSGKTLNEQWHLPNFLFACGDDVIMATANQLLSLPILILMARLCPEGAEGTVYALATSVQCVGGTVGGVWSTVWTQFFGIENYDWSRMWQLTVLTSSCKLLCIPLLPLVPKSITDTADNRRSKFAGFSILALFFGGLSYALYEITYSLLSQA